METVSDLLKILPYGKNSAQSAKQLFEAGTFKVGLDSFKRQIRFLASEARKLGHRVIGDDSGYYLAMNEKEWKDYCSRRFAAIKDELVSLAGAERIAVQDIIKVVYAVDVNNNNYHLGL